MSSTAFYRSKLFIRTVIVLVVITLIGVSAYFYYQYEMNRKNPQSEVENIVSSVAKHMILPDETPTVATVTDKAQLVNQPFFANAENGDKVLFFIESRLAVLYRPSINRIVAVSVLAEGDEVGNSEGATQLTTNSVQQQDSLEKPIETIQEEPQTATVTIYNGTTKAGITQTVANQIQQKIAAAQVVLRENASAATYQETLIIDVSGGNETAVQALATLLSAQIATVVPSSEKAPTSDILIIIGSDYSVPVTPTPTPAPSPPAEETQE